MRESFDSNSWSGPAEDVPAAIPPAFQDEAPRPRFPVSAENPESADPDFSRQSEEAKALIREGKAGILAENLPRFADLDAEVAQGLIRSGHGDAVAKNIRIFKGLDRRISYFLSPDESSLMKIIPLLGNSDIKAMIPEQFDECRQIIMENLSQDEALADCFLENINFYKNEPWAGEAMLNAVTHLSVAEKFLRIEWSMDQEPSWLNSVSAQAIVTRTIKKGRSSEGDRPKEGFQETDRFESHNWRFGANEVRSADTIAAVMRGESSADELEKIGISDAEMMKGYLERVRNAIDEEFGDFKELFLANPRISDEDKAFIFGRSPETAAGISLGMGWLPAAVENLFARIIALYKNGIEDPTPDPVPIIREGFKRFMQVFETDIPLYDKLYEEFDSHRDSGRNPLEVYIGRDGIYAYEGRRAQDIARRRKLGREGRKKLGAEGLALEIKPKYLVYPSYFRDNVSDAAKKEFLMQEGIGKDADPLFNDTGFGASIPIDIMKIMGFSEKEIEERIRLLSASVPHRKVKNLPGTEEEQIKAVSKIERNAKAERRAVGIFKDGETDAIRPVAEPTSPEEQFYYGMIKQAITRHYWVKETLHHEFPGNVSSQEA